jgi:hypothetical protein
MRAFRAAEHGLPVPDSWVQSAARMTMRHELITKTSLRPCDIDAMPKHEVMVHYAMLQKKQSDVSDD